MRVRFPNQSNESNPIELNPLDCVALSSELSELNRTELKGLRSIGSGKPIDADFSYTIMTGV